MGLFYHFLRKFQGIFWVLFLSLFIPKTIIFCYYKQPMTSESSAPLCEKAEKSLALAKILFSDEEWIAIEPNVWVAKSRLSVKKREPKKWNKEMSQIRILTKRGYMAVFLPERLEQGETDNNCADLVLDGEIMEMKTISGTRTTLGGKFRLGYKQGASLLRNCTATKKHSVFIRLLSDLHIGSVRAKIAGELKERFDDGTFICYFETTGELHSWTYDELRAIIGT